MQKLKDNLVWVGLALTLLLVVFVELQNEPDNDMTEVVVVAPDHVQTQSEQTQQIQKQAVQTQETFVVAQADNNSRFTLRKKSLMYRLIYLHCLRQSRKASPLPWHRDHLPPC
ncbi:hypothetical protein ACFQE2_15440 [Methylophaga thalassica]|uniref:hypothetical protein n=1 Tax=Methylophaga thalassica TaxID=40223 RepID=UPI0036142FD0